MADSGTIRRLWLFKSDLEEGPDDEKLIQILRRLVKLPVSITSLQETGIGKVVNSFRKREGIAGNWVQKVVNTWKAAVEKEVKKQEEEEEERESSQEPDSPRLKEECDLTDSDDRKSSSDGETEESHGHLVNGKHSDNSDSDDKEFDSARKIKQERVSSSGEDSEQEAGGGRGIHKSKDMAHLKTSSASEDDLTDSDFEEDADTGSKESYIENYYQKMLGQIDVKKEECDEKRRGSGHGRHREIKQSSEKKSNCSSSSKIRKDTNCDKVSEGRNNSRKDCDGKKRYHDLSSSDEDEVEKMSPHSGKHQSNSHGRPSLSHVEVHAKEKTLSQNGNFKHSSGDKHQKHSSSSSGEKHHKHSSSSSGDKHQKHSSSSSGDKCQKHSSSSSADKHHRLSSSSSGDKHQKHSASSSADKHQKHSSSSADKHQKHSSSSADKHQKHSSSSSGDKHQKHSSSSSGDKHQKHSSSSSGDKHQKHSPSSSGDKHQKQSSSSSGDKHQKHSSSSSGDKHQKHSPSSSGDKHQKHSSSSSGDKHQKHSSSSSGDKHQKHSPSSSGDKHQKHSSSSSGEIQKQSSSSGEKHPNFSFSSSQEKHHKSLSSSSSERHHKHASSSKSSSAKEKVHKDSSSSTSDVKSHKHSSSSSSVEKSHKRSSSSSQDSKGFSASSSRNCSRVGVFSAEGVGGNSLCLAYSPLLVSETIIKQESDEEEEKDEENEYVPSSKSNQPVEYVPSRKIKSELENSKDVEKNKYVQAVHSDDCDSDRYSPTVGWKIKKEKVSDDHKYGGENRSLYSPPSSVPSPLSYVPTKHITQENEDDDGRHEDDSDEDVHNVPYIPTKKIMKHKDTEKSSLPSTYIPTEKIKKEKRDERSSSPSVYFPTKKIKKEKDDERSSSPLTYIPTKKIKKEKGDERSPSLSKSTYIPTKKIKEEGDGERSPSPSPYIRTKQIKIERGDDRSHSPLTSTKEIKKKKDDKRSASPSNYIPTTSIKQEKGEDSSSDVSTKKIKKEREDENLSASSSDWQDDSGSEGEDDRHERRSESHLSKKRTGGSDDNENHSRPCYSPSSKTKECLSHKSHHHKYLQVKSESPQSQDKDVEMHSSGNKYDKSSSSLSSHKHDKQYSSSSKHSKTKSSSSSSSRTEKTSSSSHRKSEASDWRRVKEEETCSSSDKVVNHKTDKTLTSYKEHSSHSNASSSKSSNKLSSSDKQCDRSKETHGPTSKPSSVSSLSSKAKSSSSSPSAPKINRDKKRKENLFSDACADLFSDTIQIKAEPSPPPPRQQDNKKHAPTKSKAEDVSSKQIASSSSSATVKNEKAPVQKSKHAGETNKVLPTDLVADTDEYGPSPEKKRKVKDSFHLDEGGMSFDDFLNFDEAAVLKQKKSTSSKKSCKSSNKPSGTSSSSSPSSHRVSSSSTNSMSSRDTFSLSVPAPLKTVSVTESDILSMLPETQAFYRPLRPNPLYDREEEPLEPVDADVITSKSNVRSKVYSGRKHVLKEMKSLYDLCLQVLIDNVDALDYVGGVPYSILKPVLERCSATQLYQLEDCNPHFIEDSDELWESHCHRDFRGAEPDEMESWRELYLRKLEEQEAKYQKLKASMSTVISKGQAGRHAKLAFVDTVAKPPRDVLRQQKRYGTGCVVMASRGGRVTKDSGSAVRTYKPSLTVPAHNPLSERPRMIKATPPMLAKALQMRKNMRR